MSDVNAFLEFVNRLQALGGWGFLAIGFIAWVIWPERVDRLRASIFGLFGWLGSGVRKRSHASSIQTTLNPEIRHLEREFGLPELPNVVVHFTRSENGRKPEFRGGEVIVFIRDDMENRPENVIKCALHYVNCTVATDARPLLTKRAEQALDLVLAKRLIRGNIDAARQFTSFFLRETLAVDENLAMIYGQVDSIEAEGWLPAILLNELAYLAAHIPSALRYNQAVQQEVTGFIRFLSMIAAREKGQPFHPDYHLRHISVHVMLLATDETLEMAGLQNHLRKIASLQMAGFRAVYVLAAGQKSHLVEELLKKAQVNDALRARIEALSVKKAHKHTERGSVPRAIGYVRFRPRRTQ